jgi:MarR family transcriptional regulator, lower aerobic nicotinate degradation pathway regulator
MRAISELPVINDQVPLSGALMGNLSRRIGVAAEALLAQFGLRPRHHIALTILRDLGETGQADLAEILQIDRTNLVGLLNELETAGLIERRRSTEDRRRHTVALTTKGRRQLARAEFALLAIESDVLSGLDESERRQLHELLQRAVGGCTGAHGDC